MFQYVLAWIALSILPIAVIATVIEQLVFDSSGYIWLRLIWIPIGLWWCISKIRDYRKEKRLNNDNAE